VKAAKQSNNMTSADFKPSADATRLIETIDFVLDIANRSPTCACFSAITRPGVGLRQPLFVMIFTQPPLVLRRQKIPIHRIDVIFLTVIRERVIYRLLNKQMGSHSARFGGFSFASRYCPILIN
jgi:hypothetical protein